MSGNMAEEKTIQYKKWGSGDAGRVFILVHGLGAHAGRWAAAGEFFAQKGIVSYAVELRDFDKPDDKRETFRRYFNKTLHLCRMIRTEHQDKKIFIIGESMGALISFLLAARRPDLFSGLICVSPALTNRYKLAFSRGVKMLATLISGSSEKFKLPFDSACCTRDAGYRKKLEEDPREYRSAPVGLLAGLLLAQIRVKSLRYRMKTPVLFLIAGADKIVEPQAARTVFDSLKAGDKTIVEFPEMYHSLSIDVGREKVFEAILKWVEER